MYFWAVIVNVLVSDAALYGTPPNSDAMAADRMISADSLVFIIAPLQIGFHRLKTEAVYDSFLIYLIDTESGATMRIFTGPTNSFYSIDITSDQKPDTVNYHILIPAS